MIFCFILSFLTCAATRGSGAKAVVEIITKTGQHESDGSTDKFRLEICQGSECCQTEQIKQERLVSQLSSFSGEALLGKCYQMILHSESSVRVTITKTGRNGWFLEFVSLKTKSASYNCVVNKKLDGTLFRPDSSVTTECEVSTRNLRVLLAEKEGEEGGVKTVLPLSLGLGAIAVLVVAAVLMARRGR